MDAADHASGARAAAARAAYIPRPRLASLGAAVVDREIYLGNYPPFRRPPPRPRDHAWARGGVLELFFEDGRPEERFDLPAR